MMRKHDLSQVKKLPCPICYGEVVRYPGEPVGNFIKRRTCGKPVCVAKWRAHQNRITLGLDSGIKPEREPPADVWFEDDPQASVEPNLGRYLRGLRSTSLNRSTSTMDYDR